MNSMHQELQQDIQAISVNKHGGEEWLKHRPLNPMESTLFYGDETDDLFI